MHTSTCVHTYCTRRIIYFIFKHVTGSSSVSVEFLLSQESVSQDNLHFFFPLECSYSTGTYMYTCTWMNVVYNKVIIFFIIVNLPCLFLIVFLFFDLYAPLSSLSLLSLRYLEICSMVPLPPQFLSPRLLVEICSLVSGWTRWMVLEEEKAFNP